LLGNWRMKYLNDKWLSMNKEVAYRKILRSTNKHQIRILGRSFNKIKYKWLNRTEANVNLITEV
jgi:hypothetical protein